MPYVGNDIVSLSDWDARRKSTNSRFLKRVFTPDEQRLIQLANDPDRVLWSFWAAKETAYKVLSKKYQPLSSAPVRYAITPALATSTGHSFNSGTVETPADRVYFRLHSGDDYVHCIGADSDACLDLIRWGVKHLDVHIEKKDRPAYESRMVRQAAAEGIASFFNIDSLDVSIQGSDPPVAYLKGEPMKGDLSLSHDFPFVAYAFIVER